MSGPAKTSWVRVGLWGEVMVTRYRPMSGTVTVARHGSIYAEVAAPGEAEVRMLAVDPSARNQGVGELLMRAAAREAFAGGAARLVLSTTEQMGSAQRMYERMGLSRSRDRDTVVDGETLLVHVLERPDA